MKLKVDFESMTLREFPQIKDLALIAIDNLILSQKEERLMILERVVNT